MDHGRKNIPQPYPIRVGYSDMDGQECLEAFVNNGEGQDGDLECILRGYRGQVIRYFKVNELLVALSACS